MQRGGVRVRTPFLRRHGARPGPFAGLAPWDSRASCCKTSGGQGAHPQDPGALEPRPRRAGGDGGWRERPPSRPPRPSTHTHSPGGAMWPATSPAVLTSVGAEPGGTWNADSLPERSGASRLS